jgi:flagellar protein FlgJ
MTEIGAQEAALAAKKAQDSELVAFKQSMDRLKAELSPGPSAKQKLRKACTDFEAVFISKLWEQMRATVPKSGMFNSQQEEMYRSMFDREFTEKMAQDGGIGLGDMLYNQLKEKIKGGTKATGAQALHSQVGQLSNERNTSLAPAATGALPGKPEFKIPGRGNGLTPQAAGASSSAAQPAAPQAKAPETSAQAAPAAVAAPKPPASVPGAVMADVEALARRIEAAYDQRQAAQAIQSVQSGQAVQSGQSGQAAEAEGQGGQLSQGQPQAATQGKARYARTLRGESGIAGRRFATIG